MDRDALTGELNDVNWFIELALGILEDDDEAAAVLATEELGNAKRHLGRALEAVERGTEYD